MITVYCGPSRITKSLSSTYDTLKRTGNYNIEGTPNKGFLYKVDLPDHKFFLDWDKPLREQSPEVQAGLKAISKIQEDATFDPTLLPSADDLYGPRGPTGGTLYRILAARLGHSPEPESGLYGRQGGKEAASKLLYSVGIKGNTFLDQYSRGSMTKEEKTYNYVVFNPKDIKILDVERAAPSITLPGSPPVTPTARPPTQQGSSVPR